MLPIAGGLRLVYFFAFFVLGPLVLEAQQKDYKDDWARVESLARKNRPGAAFLETKKIYEKAKQDRQDVQVIKTLLYMSGLQSENRENNQLFAIKEIEREIINSKQPARSILQSLLAEAYWTYFSQVRWKIYNRTKTENYKSYDVDTWTTSDFHDKITELYTLSISEEKLLQSTSLEAYNDIMLKGNARILRPTLYDLLAFRAVGYFRNDERTLSKPSFHLDVDLKSSFAPAPEFVTRLSDSSSRQHPALFILRKLILFHLNDPNPAALIDADILRIQFVYSATDQPDKEKLYYNALKKVATQYDGHPAAAQAWYLLALTHEDDGNLWQPFGDSTFRYEKIKAKEICNHVSLQEKPSEGKSNCENLLTKMQLPFLEFQVERVNIPGQPFRVSANYANTPELYLRVVPASDQFMENAYTTDKKNRLVYASAPFVKEWQQALPATGDMQPHRAEIKVDALPPGKYFLVVSTKADFKDEKALLVTQKFYVSNISYIHNGPDYFVLDRESGQPLTNAKVTSWEPRIDYVKKKRYKVKFKQYQTDEHGYFRLSESDNDVQSLDISYKNDRLFSDEDEDYIYDQRNTKKNNPKISVHFFADRAIYRPGQVIYYKGIALQQDSTGRKGSVKAGHRVKVFLRNSNWEVTDSIQFITNEFGSFKGEFQLPSSVNPGYFSIHTRDDLGRYSFQVEEYKRPKFSVKFEPIKGTYRVNDSIVVTGIAQAFAGNNIDGATVKFRVVRRARFVYAWRWRGGVQPKSADFEITRGEITTDDNGKFNIVFKAHPDAAIDKGQEPVFDYTVYATVTDLNGETQSQEKQVSVSYKSLLLISDIPNKLVTDSFNFIKLRTENMNGEFEAAEITVRFDRLSDEKRLIRERMWERPDQFTMSKESYLNLFPYDVYDNEDDPKNRSVQATLFEQAGKSKIEGIWNIPKNLLPITPGFFKITITAKDKNGDEIKDITYSELYSENSKQLSNPTYIWQEINQNEIEPGETAQTEIGSSAHVFMIQRVSKGTSTLQPIDFKYSFFELNNEKRTLRFGADESDRGGYGVSWAFVKHNRIYIREQHIKVPWSNKDLKIDYISYRDKTEPGNTEKWKIKISGYKKEQVATEALVSMYDASLDEITTHNWLAPRLWSSYYHTSSWGSSDNFSSLESIVVEWLRTTTSKFDKVYDVLISTYIFSPQYKGKGVEPLWWLNPLEYAYSEERNPRLMRLPKRVFANEQEALEAQANGDILPDADGDGITDQFDTEFNPIDKTVPPDELKIRKNFNETAFFFPQLITDSEGAIEFTFTLPESLTSWKFQALAHTKDLAFGMNRKTIVTQKQLMVQPNAPRFVRENDKIVLNCKIVNLSDTLVRGNVTLQLIETATGQTLDVLLKNKQADQLFTLARGKSMALKFPIEIPVDFTKPLSWRLVAKGGGYADGEENILPVLPNRTLVTETMPLMVKGHTTKNFTFNKLLQSPNSPTLQHKSLTIEYTSNPVWSAVQSLPYLIEYPYECSEQTWNRYYANSLAASVLKNSPRIKQVFENWKIQDTSALKSALEKNEELKSIILQETPWVMQGKSETEQKKNIALLMDMENMSRQLGQAYDKLKQKQNLDGGFPWFDGPRDRYITQYIVTGIAHLKKLNAVMPGEEKKLDKILDKALIYLDRDLYDDYNNLLKEKADLDKDHLGYLQIHHLYLLSFLPDYKISGFAEKAYTFYLKQAEQFWGDKNKYMQGMIALVMHRNNKKAIAGDILQSLRETSVYNEELGRYWKAQNSWFWYQASIETQALLVEAFQEAGNDITTADEIRTWLLTNKQTNRWSTTKSTAEASYALLLQGTDLINSEAVVDIKLGNTIINSSSYPQEAGSGYFKTVITDKKVEPGMGNITVSVTSPSALPAKSQRTSWGGVYWQYFEDLDKISNAAGPLSVSKKLFVERNSEQGPVIRPIEKNDTIKVGDKIKVQIVLRTDRDMEYVHMKDMRAASLEPSNVLSTYKYSDNLGYYQSVRDASMNFFFNYIPKGTYVLEYDLFVTHAGNFSNGITTVQSMYAPEFSSHSEGVRINVK